MSEEFIRPENKGLIRPAFTTTKLEEERENRDQINLSLDKDLRKLVNQIKGRLNMPNDASTLKIMLEWGGKSIINTLSVDSWKRISDKDRIRFTKKGQEEMLE